MRSVPHAQASKVIHQEESTSQIKQEAGTRGLSASCGTETQRQYYRMVVTSSFLTSRLSTWYLSPAKAILEERENQNLHAKIENMAEAQGVQGILINIH